MIINSRYWYNQNGEVFFETIRRDAVFSYADLQFRKQREFPTKVERATPFSSRCGESEGTISAVDMAYTKVLFLYDVPPYGLPVPIILQSSKKKASPNGTLGDDSHFQLGENTLLFRRRACL